VPTLPSLVPGIAAGAIPVALFGGQDTVQGISFLTAAGSVFSRCEMSIMWVTN
jgi:hypothetical protein